MGSKVSFSKASHILEKAFSNAESVAAYWVCGGLVVLIMFWVATEVISRFIFNYCFRGLMDIVVLMVVVVAFLSLSVIQKDKRHIRMDLLENKLSRGRIGFIVQSIIVALSLITSAILCYLAAKYAILAYSEQSATETLLLPFWPVALLIPVSFFLLTIRFGLQIRKYLPKIFFKT